MYFLLECKICLIFQTSILLLQGESAVTHRVNYAYYLPMHPVNPLSGNALYYFTQSNAR